MEGKQALEGTVTILFTDVVGSSSLATTLGDEAAQELMRAYGRIVREGIEKHEGYEVKTIGDAFMVAFNSCVRAVACSCDIQRGLAWHNRLHPERPLAVRMGMNCGEVIRERGDFFGAAVNEAAAVAAAAEGGQILVSELVKRLLEPFRDIHLTLRGPHQLKGLREARDLYEVTWQREATVASTLAKALEDKTPFIGREAELEVIEGVVGSASRGHGGTVMLAGEPGLGKTRLAREAAAYAGDRGFLVLAGNCHEVGAAAAYGPFVEALKSVVSTSQPAALEEMLGDDAAWVAKLIPEIRQKLPQLPNAPGLPPEQEQHVLVNALVSYVVHLARIKPVFLIVEDLQWADRATLLLLRSMTRDTQEAPLVIVGTYRDVEVDSSHPLAETLAELHRHRLFRSLALRGFERAEVFQILTALGGQSPPGTLVEAIHQKTEGNPFFVEEIIKYLVEEGRLLNSEGDWRDDVAIDMLDVPRGLRLVIENRLSRLSDDCRHALATAAAIGRDFSYELLRAACGLERDALMNALDEAQGAYVIEGQQANGDVRYAFTHELIRQTSYTGIPLASRQRTHLAIATAMEEAYRNELEAHASELAYHYSQAGVAGDQEKTRVYCGLAGKRAMSEGAFENAIRYYQQAIELTSGDDGERAALLFRLGLAERSIGRWDIAVANWEKASSIYETCGDGAGVEQVSYSLARLHGWRGQFTEAIRAVQRGLTTPGDSRRETRSRLLALAGTLLSLGGQPKAAEQLLEQSLAIAENAGDPGLLGNALGTKGLHQWAHTRFAESYETLSQAEELLRSAGDLSGLSQCFGSLLTPLGYLGRHADMELRLSEFDALANKLGDAGGIASHAIFRAVLAMVRGELSEAERWAVAAEEIARSSAWLVLPTATHILGEVQLHFGRLDRAEELFLDTERTQREMDISSAIFEAWPSLLFFRAFVDDLKGAQSLLARLADLSGPMTCARYDGMVSAAAALVMLGQKEEAAQLYPKMLGMADQGVVFAANSFPLLSRVLGMVAAACGWWEKAIRHYESALATAKALGARKEVAETNFWYARGLLERDRSEDHERALAMLDAALEGYRSIGMSKHVEKAERVLAQPGQR